MVNVDRGGGRGERGVWAGWTGVVDVEGWGDWGRIGSGVDELSGSHVASGGGADVAA